MFYDYNHVNSSVLMIVLISHNMCNSTLDSQQQDLASSVDHGGQPP